VQRGNVKENQKSGGEPCTVLWFFFYNADCEKNLYFLKFSQLPSKKKTAGQEHSPEPAVQFLDKPKNFVKKY